MVRQDRLVLQGQQRTLELQGLQESQGLLAQGSRGHREFKAK